MSREYKFRLWNRKDKEWDSPSLMEVWNAEAVLSTMYGMDDYVISQWTGLKDKNGKDVYEGDIVKVARCHTTSNPSPSGGAIKVELVEDGVETGHVFWAECSFEYLVSFEHLRYDDTEKLCYNSSRVEVVGNVYENGNLIN